MPDRLPKFDAPPVVEVVLGVQFARLPGYSTAYAGWFWRECLPEEWRQAKANDAVRLEDQFELFGDNRHWRPGGSGFLLREASEPERVQIVLPSEDRMIQIQDSRFVYNWRRREGGYPSFIQLHDEFRMLYERFSRFTRDAGLGELEPNQWEVTYVNHIPKGELWYSFADWPRVIPNLYVPPRLDSVEPEMFRGEWQQLLQEDRGRLHISLRYAKRLPDGPEVIVLNNTARGTVDPEKGQSVESGFDLGHRSIVLTFAAMTSEEAHRHWKRRA